MGHRGDQDESMTRSSEEILYSSLLECVVDYIGRDSLDRVVVHADPRLGAARVDICLDNESYDLFTHAIERMGQVRVMFMDELSVDYVLSAGDGCSSDLAPVKELVYA